MICCHHDKKLLTEQDKNLLSASLVMGNAGKYPKNYIKELREARGWTTRDVAEKAGPGWHGQTVSKLELQKQELSWSKLLRLAEVFEVHPLEITEGPGHVAAPKTPQEKELLELFRNLQDKDQDRLIGYIEGKLEKKQ
jgi:transcriptional regulator with XRE-family HTH domain